MCDSSKVNSPHEGFTEVVTCIANIPQSGEMSRRMCNSAGRGNQIRRTRFAIRGTFAKRVVESCNGHAADHDWCVEDCDVRGMERLHASATCIVNGQDMRLIEMAQLKSSLVRE